MLDTTIAGSLPKPPWLVSRIGSGRRGCSGRGARRGRRDAVRLALGSGRGRHRHRQRRRADAEALRPRLPRALDGIDFRSGTIGIRADRYKAEVPTVTGPSPGAPTTRDEVDGRAHTGGEVHHAGPDDHGRHARRRALPQPRQARPRWPHPQRGGARDRRAGIDVLQFDEPAFNVYMDEVRDWGIAALERAARAWSARPPCTSATDTGSRPITTGRRHSAPSGASTKDLPAAGQEPDRPGIAGVRELARADGDDRTAKGQGRAGGRIDVATERSETPEEVAATIRAACSSCRPSGKFPCTNCGMVPLPATSRGPSCARSPPAPCRARRAEAQSCSRSGLPRTASSPVAYSLDALIQWGGYAFLGAILFAETGLLMGFVLPGDSLLFTIGVVAGAGALEHRAPLLPC